VTKSTKCHVRQIVEKCKKLFEIIHAMEMGKWIPKYLKPELRGEHGPVVTHLLAPCLAGVALFRASNGTALFETRL
jgi:hypothetical protein